MNTVEAKALVTKPNARRSKLLNGLQILLNSRAADRMGGWMAADVHEADVAVSDISLLMYRLVGTGDEHTERALNILLSSPVAAELPQFLPQQTPFTPHYMTGKPSDREVRDTIAGAHGDGDYLTWVMQNATPGQISQAKSYYKEFPYRELQDR